MSEPLFDFIRSWFPDESPIALHRPLLGDHEKCYLSRCVDSSFVSSIGPMVRQFEERLGQYTGHKHAIVTVNGTAALHLGLLALGADANCEVIMQPLTFIATANAVNYTGAAPVFVDIEKRHLGVCPHKLRDWLTENTRRDGKHCVNRSTGKRILGCLCMHTFGMPSDLEGLRSVCHEFDIALLEDGAEALGSYFAGRHVGHAGRWLALSFNGNKVITTGGGGALLTDDDVLAARVRHLATTAKCSHPWETCHDEVGYNYRMPNINAALGCAQLDRLDAILADKVELANAYRQLMHSLPGDFVEAADNTQSNNWLNTILCETESQRRYLLERSVEESIQLRPPWELVCDSPAYRHMQRGPLTVAREMQGRLLNLPSSCRRRLAGA